MGRRWSLTILLSATARVELHSPAPCASLAKLWCGRSAHRGGPSFGRHADVTLPNSGRHRQRLGYKHNLQDRAATPGGTQAILSGDARPGAPNGARTLQHAAERSRARGIAPGRPARPAAARNGGLPQVRAVAALCVRLLHVPRHRGAEITPRCATGVYWVLGGRQRRIWVAREASRAAHSHPGVPGHGRTDL
jgi:hypothetical protein